MAGRDCGRSSAARRRRTACPRARASATYARLRAHRQCLALFTHYKAVCFSDRKCDLKRSEKLNSVYSYNSRKHHNHTNSCCFRCCSPVSYFLFSFLFSCSIELAGVYLRGLRVRSCRSACLSRDPRSRQGARAPRRAAASQLAVRGREQG